MSNTQYQDIVVRVDAKGAITVLNQATDAINKFDSAAQGAEHGLNKFERQIAKIRPGLQGMASEVGGLGKFVGVSFGAAIAAGAGFAGVLGKIAMQGEKLADVENAFNRLAAAAGLSGDVILSKFDRALDSTVPKMEEMQFLAKMLSAGLDPKNFELYAKAARSMGEAFGEDAAGGLERMYRAIVGGQPETLKALGVTISAESAARKWARANANLGRSYEDVLRRMTPQAKLIAMQEEATEQLKIKYEGLGDATIGAGKAFQQIEIAAKDGFHEITKGIGTNRELAEVFSELAAIMRELPWESVSEGLSKIVTHIIPAKQTCVELADAASKAWAELKNLASETFSVKVQIDQIDNLSWLESPTLKGIKLVADMFKPVKEEVEQVSAEGQTQIDIWDQLAANVKLFDNNLKAAKKSSKELLEPISNKESTRQIERQAQEMADFARTIRGVNGPLGQFEKAIRAAFNDDTITTTEQFYQAIDQIGASAQRAKIPLNEILRLYQQIKSESQQQYSQPAGPGDGPEADWFEKYSGLSDIGKWISDNVVDDPDTAAKIESTGADIANQLFNGIHGGMNGEDWKGLAQGIGSTIGGALGSEFGPIGEAVGSFLGSEIIGGVFDVFSHEKSEGSKQRHQVEAFFEEMFDGKHLAVIVNGQLKELETIVMQGNTLFGGAVSFHNGPANDVLNSLSGQAQMAFKGIAAAFEEMAGVSKDFEGYLAGALANNLGNLNNLQMALEATGKTFQEMGDAAMQAFLNMKMSALEAQEALETMQQVMTKGIPDSIGAIDVAFQNFVTAGYSGGRALLDAIGDIGVEAAEAGITTFDQLSNLLISKYGFTAEQVKIFIDGIKATGINSINELAQAGQQTLLAAASNMQEISNGGTPTHKAVVFESSKTSSPSYSNASHSAATRTADDAKKATQEIRKLVEGSSQYADIVAKLTEKEISRTEAGKEILKLYKSTTKANKELTSAENALDHYLATHKGASMQSKKLAELEMRVEKAQKAMKKFSEDALSQSDQIMNKFLSGESSISEAFKAFEKTLPGIPGKIGDVKTAWKEFTDSGKNGGRYTVEAIKGIAAEIKELGGAGDMNDMIQNLMQVGGMTQAEAQKWVDAANQSGLDSVEDFLNISNEDALKFLGTLDQLKFPFKDTSDNIKKLLDQIEELKKKKVTVDIELKVRSSYQDSTTRKLAAAASIGTNYGQSQGAGRR